MLPGTQTVTLVNAPFVYGPSPAASVGPVLTEIANTFGPVGAGPLGEEGEVGEMLELEQPKANSNNPDDSNAMNTRKGL
ncbi:MAG: hypothetical protein WAN10_15905 [Candidatus Acidiferrales bacterium]